MQYSTTCIAFVPFMTYSQVFIWLTFESAYGQKHVKEIGCSNKQFGHFNSFIWKGTSSVIADFLHSHIFIFWASWNLYIIRQWMDPKFNKTFENFLETFIMTWVWIPFCLHTLKLPNWLSSFSPLLLIQNHLCSVFLAVINPFFLLKLLLGLYHH